MKDHIKKPSGKSPHTHTHTQTLRAVIQEVSYSNDADVLETSLS